MLLGGIIELGLIFMGQISLDNAMALSARQIRTGQLVSSSNAATQVIQRDAFRDSVCDNMKWMVADCKANLSIDVRTYSQFSNVTLPSPITNGVFNPGTLTYDTGVPNSIVLVRAYYNWKLYMPVLNQALERTPGKTLLTSVTTFSTEPY
jgi:Flp pilus assembly protein TadG